MLIIGFENVMNTAKPLPPPQSMTSPYMSGMESVLRSLCIQTKIHVVIIYLFIFPFLSYYAVVLQEL